MSTRSDERSRMAARRGISLMEVLISAFIMAVGLLGVAALLPVGHHEASKGLIADRAAEIGRMAFRDFQIRGIDPGDDITYQATFRSPDDDRFTYMVWARREPYGGSAQLDSNLETLEEFATVLNNQNAENSRVRYFPLNFVDPQVPMEADQDYYDVDHAKMRVVVFVFHTVDTKKQVFDPKNPANCAPENRPVAVFEKIMPVEGTSDWR